MRITPHFNLDEFECPDGTQYPLKWIPRLRLLCDSLEWIRAECMDSNIEITSGYRTREYNDYLRKKRKIKTAKNSKHIEGIAIDFKVKGFSPRSLVKIIKDLMKKGSIKKGGVKAYSRHVHYDQRGRMASW